MAIKTLQHLPFEQEDQLETREVLKQVAISHRYLAELKGISKTIPNDAILINTLSLQEAKDSSEVENIITTHDDLFKAGLFSEGSASPAAKEVQDYRTALKSGFKQVSNSGLIRLSDILDIQQQIEKNRAGLRKLPGTDLRNQLTGKIIYTPPQDAQEVATLMDNLINYINDDQQSTLDPLIKLALIHHQFESIHPFYDGNGRTGRILNILYLVSNRLLDIPILYLSRYFIQNKSEYYAQLQAVRDQQDWQSWLLYILKGIEITAKQTIQLIQSIKTLMQQYKNRIRTELPKIYSQELLNNLFNHPYTKIDFVVQDLNITRITATSYLNQLVAQGLLKKQKWGRSKYYINVPLYELLINIPNTKGEKN